MLLGVMIVFAAIAVADLATGFLLDDWRIDAALLAGCALGLWSFLEIRWLARKVRTNQVPRRLGTGRWSAIVAGCLLTLAFTAGMGYLTGGPRGAFLFLAGVIVLSSIGIVHGFRKRKSTGRTAG
jgi:hypothetical protein